MTLSVSAVKNLLQTKYRDLYIDMLVKNLEHLECEDLSQAISPDMDFDTLSKIVDRCAEHILSGSLLDNILVELTNLSPIEEEVLLKNLRANNICAPVRNIVTEKSKRLRNPRGFKMELYPPQRAVLLRMLDIEKMAPHKIGGKSVVLRTGVLSERLGFGKSLISCALLTTSKIQTRKTLCARKHAIMPELEPGKRLIPMDIVICNLKKTAEWESNVREYTDLSVKKITSSKMLADFISKFNAGTTPDVLVLKDGKLVGIPVLETIKEVLSGCRVNRLIVDDYDALNMSPTCEYPAAQFYWLVSSTSDEPDVSRKCKGSLAKRDYPCLQSIIDNKTMLDRFVNVRCSPDFLTEEYSVPIIDYFCKNICLEQAFCKKCMALSKREKSKCDKCSVDYSLEACGECSACELGFWGICESKRQKQVCYVCYYSSSEEVPICVNCRKKSIRSKRQEIIGAIEDFILGEPQQELCDIPRYYKKLLPGRINNPAPNGVPVKALFLAEDNSSDWNFNRVVSSCINSRNISSFETSRAQLGVCKKLSGVDLSYVSHIIVTSISKADDIVQFIGRAQRLGREYNLKLLVIQ